MGATKPQPTDGLGESSGLASSGFKGGDPAEIGARGGSAPRRPPESTPVPAVLKRNIGKLAQNLIDAANGEGKFTTLKPEQQLLATFRALEWGLGKPASRPNRRTGEVKPEEPGGLVIT